MTVIDLNRTDGSGASDELDLERVVASALTRWPTAGLCVAVVRNGAVDFFSHGVADVATQRPASKDTVFRIGSLTKTITAVAVMQLCEAGLVDLDAPANDYLRAFQLVPAKASFGPATVRHLLTHTAGAGFWRRLSDVLAPRCRLGRDGAGRRTARRVLPRRSASRRRAGDQVGVQQPRVRRPGPDRGGRLGRAARPVLPRARLRARSGMEHTALVLSDQLRAELATGYTLRSARAGARRTPGGSHARRRRPVLHGCRHGALRHRAVARRRRTRPAACSPRRQSRTMFRPHFQPDPRVRGHGPGLRAARGERPPARRQGRDHARFPVGDRDCPRTTVSA